MTVTPIKRRRRVDYSAVDDILIPYRRVSTREQAESGAGIGAQDKPIKAYLEYRAKTALTWDCIDEGVSGKDILRPGLANALNLVRAGKAGGIVVSKLDRLSRSIQDFAYLITASTKEGWSLVLLDLQVDTSTPVGKLLANMMAAIAEFERDIIAQRTREGLAIKREQGVRLGRPREADDDLLAEVVRLWLGTQSWTAVANLLNEQGVETVQGGRLWYPATVRKMVLSQDGQKLVGAA